MPFPGRNDKAKCELDRTCYKRCNGSAASAHCRDTEHSEDKHRIEADIPENRRAADNHADFNMVCDFHHRQITLRYTVYEVRESRYPQIIASDPDERFGIGKDHHKEIGYEHARKKEHKRNNR